MIIRKLLLSGFGKFENRTIEFKDGFNLIHGPNEAGKSTVHAFIEAMLYGFLDPTARRRKFFDEHDKYRPKTNIAYGGALIIKRDDGVFRIERTLDKTRFSLRVLNNDTGKDITASLPYSDRERTADIAAWLDVPYAVYRSSLSVAQDHHALHQDASEPLFMRLQNVAKTKSESLSADRAIARLTAQQQDIGSAIAAKKPYAQAIKRRDALQAELKDAEGNHEAILKTLEDMDAAQAKKEALIRLENTAKNAKKRLENAEKIRVCDTLKALREKERDRKETIDKLAPYTTFNEDDLYRAISLSQTAEDLKQDQEALTLKRDALREEIQALPDAGAQKDAPSIEALSADRKEIYENERARLDINAEYEGERLKTAQDERKARLAALEAARRRVRRMLYVSFLVLPIPYILYLFFVIRRLKHALRALDQRISACERTRRVKEEKTRRFQDAINTLLARYDVESVEQFETMFANLYTSREHAETRRVKDRALKDADKQLETLIRRVQKAETSLKDIFARYGVTNMDALRAFAKQHETYHKTVAEHETIRENRIEKEAGVPLEKRLAAIDESLPPPDDDTTKAAALAENHRAEIHRVSLDIESLKTAMVHQKDRVRDIDLITRDLTKTEDDIAVMDAKQTRIANAIKRIEDASRQLENTFAPVLAQSVSGYLKTLTDSRYRDIRIQKNLDFLVAVGAAERLEKESYFSHGTREQVYLAIRFGILKALSLETMPLMLDEAFAYTDDTRLQKAMDIFSRWAKTRQILFFTCHEREANLLVKSDIAHHKISI